MTFKLTADDITKLIAKYATTEFPQLKVISGKTGSVHLYSNGETFWAELEVDKGEAV